MTKTRPTRVAYFGNVVNSHFRAVRALRAKGVDAHLFVSTSDGPTARPENDDPSLAGAYPDWIHLGSWITPRSVVAPKHAAITRELAAFDVVVASGPGPLFAQFARRPWAFYVTGGDLTVKPFPVTFWRWYPTWSHRAAECVAGFWQRRAARRATQLWLQPFAPMVDAAERLHVPASSRSDHYIPIVLDTEAYAPDAEADPEAARYVEAAVGDAGLVVFHPSRLVMERSDDLVRTGQWKGNDTLLRGVAELRASRPDLDVVVAMPDTPLSRDLDQAKALIAELGIENNVRWLVPPDRRIFDQSYMHALYRRADVVADEFGVGWFGYVTLEGLAMGKPVVGTVDEAAMAKLYPNHPIRGAITPTDVATQLACIADDPESARAAGAAGRAWVVEHHSEEAVAAIHLRAIEDLARLA